MDYLILLYIQKSNKIKISKDLFASAMFANDSLYKTYVHIIKLNKKGISKYFIFICKANNKIFTLKIDKYQHVRIHKAIEVTIKYNTIIQTKFLIMFLTCGLQYFRYSLFYFCDYIK